MGNTASNNKRIAKNTMYMYIRMFVTMIVGLYTSRAVLAALGFDDYGLYNVIGGIVAMFGFINGAMTNTTSRYITFYLENKNTEKLKKVFSTSFFIHVAITFLIVLLGETLGLWYVINKMVIPVGRLSAAIWVYQFTIISSALTIISVPFSASIIAYERMSAYAIITIIDALLKLCVAISLYYSPFDKLLYYGLIMMLIHIITNSIYWLYSYKNFNSIRIQLVFNKSLFKEMFGFTGWNLFGNFSYLFFSQGVNLILNVFCGTTVNAARGVAVQVEGVVRQFATNVQTAINPQIIKSYAKSEKERFFSLIYASSRYCFYLLLFLTLPIVLETDFLLTIWLGNYPDHTVNFIRITLIMVTLEALVTPMFTANLASGKVRIYQIWMCVISIVFIPLTFLSIKIYNIPEIVFVCTLIMTIVEIIARLFIVHYQVNLPRMEYIKEVVCNILEVAIIAPIIPLFVHMQLDVGFFRFLIVGVVSVMSVLSVVYSIGVTKQERTFINSIIRDRVLLFFKR